MDAADVRNLYEAYRSVYEDQEDLQEAPYQIYGPDPHGPSDAPSQPLGKPYKNKKRAKSRADKLDQEIGGYRHSVRHVPEEVDLYDVVLDHLFDEGYCDDVDSAEIIMANMSEEWLDDIVEGVADKKAPPEIRAKVRNARAGFIKSIGSEESRTRNRRREHRERRGMRGNIGGEGGASYRYDDNMDKDYPSIKVRGRGYA